MALTGMLDYLASIDGVRAVILAGRDGLPIACAPRTAEDVDALAALGTAALSDALNLGVEARRAPLVGVLFEYQDGLVCVEPLGAFGVAIAQLDAAAALVPWRQTLRQSQGEILATLDTL